MKSELCLYCSALHCCCSQARAGTLAIEDMDGGTFTISNGGVFGSMFGTPIINPPQSAILGMHGIFDRPVAVGGKVCLEFLFFIFINVCCPCCQRLWLIISIY